MGWFCFPISRESDASEEGIKEAEWSSAGCFWCCLDVVCGGIVGKWDELIYDV